MSVGRRVVLGGAAAALASARLRRAEAEAPKQGGVLRVSAYGDITSFDPATGRSGEDHVQLYPLYDTLIDYDFTTLTARPRLATVWNFIDPKTLVLDLRPGVLFHDGTACDAAAVKYNLDRVRSYARSNIKADVDALDTVEARGTQQVVLHLKRPDTALPLVLSDRAGMMVSPTAFEKYGEAFDRNPVGAGAMRFVEWRDKDRTVYARNDKYWQPGRPYLDGIRFALISDLQTGLRSVMTGENDFIYALTPQQMMLARRARDLVTSASPTLFCQLLFFNYGRGPMADARVRQAINYAIDRKAFDQASALDLYQIAEMLLPKEHWAYDASLAGHYPHDPARARALLAEAGHRDGITLDLMAYNDQASQQRAEILIEQMKAGGITLRMKSGALPEITGQFFSGKIGDMLLAAWTGRPDPSLSYALMFGKNGYFNPGGAEMPGLEDALAATRVSEALDVRKTAFATVQKIVIDNALCAPLLFQSQLVAHNTKVQGWQPTLLGKPRFDDVFLSG